jgi:hypothetical protein
VTVTAADLPLSVRDHTRPAPVLSSNSGYRDFLLQNHDAEEREYPAADQIREVLIHGNYLSQKDIEICLGFDLAGLADHPQSGSIRELRQALIEEYGAEGEHGAL